MFYKTIAILEKSLIKKNIPHFFQQLLCTVFLNKLDKRVVFQTEIIPLPTFDQTAAFFK